MEGLNKLKGSRKAYRSHLTRIYGKLDELDLTQPLDKDTIITVTAYIEQIQRKAESIQQLDTQIELNCLIERVHSKFLNKVPPAYHSRFSFTLIERRRFHTAVQIFKSIHQISPPYLHKIFQFSRDVTGHVSCNFNRLFVPRASTNFGKRSFFYRGAVLWNSLPSIVSEAATVPSFKSLYFNSD